MDGAATVDGRCPHHDAEAAKAALVAETAWEAWEAWG